MTREIRTELLKLSTIRVTWGLLVGAACLSALFASLEASRAGHGNSGVPPITTATGLLTVTTVTGFGMLLAAVLGVISATGEFRHGSATLTYLATPNRTRVLAAKAAAAACFGAGFGLVAALVSVGIGVGVAAGHPGGLALGAGPWPGTRPARSSAARCWARSGWPSARWSAPSWPRSSGSSCGRW